MRRPPRVKSLFRFWIRQLRPDSKKLPSSSSSNNCEVLSWINSRGTQLLRLSQPLSPRSFNSPWVARRFRSPGSPTNGTDKSRSPSASSDSWRRHTNWAFCVTAKYPSSYSIPTTSCFSMHQRTWTKCYSSILVSREKFLCFLKWPFGHNITWTQTQNPFCNLHVYTCVPLGLGLLLVNMIELETAFLHNGIFNYPLLHGTRNECAMVIRTHCLLLRKWLRFWSQ